MQQRSLPIQSAVTNRRLITRSGLLFYFFALIIFGFVIVYFSEIRRGFSLLKKVNIYWLLMAALLQLVTYLFNAFIYRSLLKIYQGIYTPSLKEFYKLSVISLFFNQTVPSAGVSGNAFLFSYLQRKNIASPLILSLIILELLSFYLAIEIIILSFFGFSFLKDWPYIFHTILLSGFFVYLLFTIAIIMTGRKKTFDLIYKKLRRRRWFKVFYKKLQPHSGDEKFGHEFIELIPLLKQKWNILVKASLLQLLLFATDLFTIVALFNGLNVHVSISAVALSLICTKIISLLPFSPGALILYESTMTFFL